MTARDTISYDDQLPFVAERPVPGCYSRALRETSPESKHAATNIFGSPCGDRLLAGTCARAAVIADHRRFGIGIPVILWKLHGRVFPRSSSGRLCRGQRCQSRTAMGRRQLRPRQGNGRRSRFPPLERDLRKRQSSRHRAQENHLDDSRRLHHRPRSGEIRLRGEHEPARRQHDRHGSLFQRSHHQAHGDAEGADSSATRFAFLAISQKPQRRRRHAGPEGCDSRYAGKHSDRTRQQ